MPEEQVITIPAFGIEADHPRNSDLLIQSVPGLRLRSSISGMKHTTNKDGDPVVPVDQSRHLASFPQLPGMRLEVNPEALTYAVIDPLHGNEELCRRITKWLRDQTGFRGQDVVQGLPPREGKLDNEHRMKTLCREMYNLVQAGEAKPLRGRGMVFPDMVDIESLPGKFLLNPGLRTQTTQPMFEEDWPQWLRELQKAGG